MLMAFDQLLYDESGFLCNRISLLDAWKAGELYTLQIKETEELYTQFALRRDLADFLGSTPGSLQLPVLCWRTDGDACKILWVAKQVRRLGLGTELVRGLTIKRAQNIVDESRGFWERTGVATEEDPGLNGQLADGTRY